ncbi:phosphatase PAP2 family protein [Lysinibacter sp. HNR]|uniref:phosphatase PAP2 family protein n=1 Tax=Lysinibacter sp. HNR TaxID=3031408 RepID=UPI002435FC93|nr:phosphatase PAP2 family protein [Lysinibacter sp. HNR]WGD36403.1 phosphatase PAP2 family protein [Lysinibacter sp. HNR]
MTTDENSARRLRNWTLFAGCIALLLMALLSAVVYFSPDKQPFPFDRWWMSAVLEGHTEVFTAISHVLNTVGGGVIAIFIIPVGVTAFLLLCKRPWGAFYFLLTSAAVAAIVQVLKRLIERSRPEEIMIHSDFGSFPSGHSANAALIAVALGLIFPRVWVWAVGSAYVILMVFSRTYLGAHWASDTFAGVLIGAGCALVIFALFSSRISAEPRQNRRVATGTSA